MLENINKIETNDINTIYDILNFFIKDFVQELYQNIYMYDLFGHMYNIRNVYKGIGVSNHLLKKFYIDLDFVISLDSLDILGFRVSQTIDQKQVETACSRILEFQDCNEIISNIVYEVIKKYSFLISEVNNEL